MFQVTTLISTTEKLERELIENPPPTEADVEAARFVVKERGEAVAELKAAKASKEAILASVAELNDAKANFAATEARSRLKPGLPKVDGKIDYSQDFFGRQAFLTVSGQLQVETYACGLSDVYTFGPTFRAENSHTSRHLAEFWMVEPELAFADLEVIKHFIFVLFCCCSVLKLVYFCVGRYELRRSICEIHVQVAA